MKTQSLIGLTATIALLFLSGRAVAEDKADICRTSYEGAQVSMKSVEGKKDLLKAREELRTCLRSDCKDWIVADCARWLTDVESRIPTIVFAARDASGHDLTDARVTTEAGDVLADVLDGRSIEVNPGRYTFVFVRPDGGRHDQIAVVREGEKVQVITATFEAPPGTPAQPSTPGPQPTAAATSHGLRPLGYAAGGLGVAGLVAGSVFGLMAMSAKNSGNCDGDLCDAGTRDKTYPYATASTIGFIAGAVLVAAGTVVVLLSPSNAKRAASLVRPATSLSITW